MQLNKDKFEFLNETIEGWQQSGKIGEHKAEELKSTYGLKKFNWQAVVVYTFIIAVVSAVLSVVVLLADRPLREWIEKLTSVSDTFISVLLSGFSVLCFVLYGKKQKNTHTTVSNTAFLMFACFLSTASVAYWAKTFHVIAQHYASVFFIAAVVYCAVAYYFRSQVVWVLMLLMLLFAFGLFTYKYQSSDGYWFNLNITLRYLVLSLLVLPLYLLLQKQIQFSFAVKVQFVFGWILFYVSLWMCSLFGNYASLDRWNDVAQYNFILYAVLLFVVSLSVMYLSLKKQNTTLSGISLVFFILNLITRYFEYFWKPLHKSVFFLLLALLFWFAGVQIEKYVFRKSVKERIP